MHGIKGKSLMGNSERISHIFIDRDAPRKIKTLAQRTSPDLRPGTIEVAGAT